MFEYVLFDLDGTLTDSKPGIFHSIRYSLEKYGMTAEDEQLQPFVGPPLLDSYQKIFGFSEEKAREAVVYYRQYFNPKGMLENSVYPGIPEALQTLKNAGRHVMVATSKPEEFARFILDSFGLTSCFEKIAGAAMDETRTNKDEVLRYLLDQIPDAEKAAAEGRVLMVGDRRYDVTGAKALGIPCLGVRYGYADPGELEEAGAFAVADSVEEMCRWILEH